MNMSRSIAIVVMRELKQLSEKIYLVEGRVFLKSVKRSCWAGMSRKSSSMGYISSQSDSVAMRHVEIGDLSEYLRHRQTYRWYFDFCWFVKGTLRFEGKRC